MIAPREVRIGTVTIHAASVREARALADALPAALERALHDSTRLNQAQAAGTIDAGSIALPAAARALPARVAERIIAAATGQAGER
jgi:hypothetical protein